MKEIPSPLEAARLATLREYDRLDQAGDRALTDLCTAAAKACGTPVALLSLVGEDRQWFKARHGFGLPGTSREFSFCAQMIQQTAPMVVLDACHDRRFAGNPLVTASPSIRFYAGVPLISSEGHPLGGFCIIDHAPRAAFPEEQLQQLVRLGAVATALLNQQRRMRAHLLDSARFRAIFEQEPECVKLTARDGSLLEMNPAGLRLLGAESLAQVQGHCVFPLVAEADRPAYQAMHERVFAGEAVRLEFTMTSLKGRSHLMESHASPVRDERGDIFAALSLTRDITERRQQEEHLLRTQRMENLGLLAAGIAHDFNNILTPMLMTASLLRPRAAAEDRHLLDLLERSAARGAALVKRILSFAHGLDGERHTVSLKPVARDIINLVEETFPCRLRIETAVAADLRPVKANPTQIHQVLLNLCINARDAMPEGGRLGIRLANCELTAADAVSIPDARAGHFVLLEVSDTGAGIPPEVMTRIWEPFFTTKAPGRGTGLGLSTIRQIVRTHEGFCTVDSRPACGSVFRVYLPAGEEGHQTRPPMDPAGSSVPGQGELVLVIEDEPFIRDTAEAALTRGGYRVLSAADGPAAVELIARHQTGLRLAIIDRHLPHISGDGLVALLRKQHPGIRLLMTSGGSDSNESTPLPENVTLLPKPYAPQDLLAAVHRALGDQ